MKFGADKMKLGSFELIAYHKLGDLHAIQCLYIYILCAINLKAKMASVKHWFLLIRQLWAFEHESLTADIAQRTNVCDLLGLLEIKKRKKQWGKESAYFSVLDYLIISSREISLIASLKIELSGKKGRKHNTCRHGILWQLEKNKIYWRIAINHFNGDRNLMHCKFIYVRKMWHAPVTSILIQTMGLCLQANPSAIIKESCDVLGRD